MNVMTLGSLVAFLQYMNRLYNPALDLFYLYEDVTKAKVAMKEVMILLGEPRQPVHTAKKPLTDTMRELCLKGICYSIGDKEILRDINLVFKKGKRYAIVGSSGSGKTSLVGLLSRLYEPTAGIMLMNREPVGHYSIYDWLCRVSLVSQESTIFHDTVSYNVRYGSFASTDQQVRHAMAMTELDALDEDADKCPDMVISDNGGSLSGGQRQRIMLARAMLRVNDLLILDEATSALDSKSEKKILRQLSRMFSDKILILISHRLSTVLDMDVILVMENGRIVEQGTHLELIAANGAYYRLFQDQLNGIVEVTT
jgi:ABC-type multidrug transport system fused ATPase/permease subunit